MATRIEPTSTLSEAITDVAQALGVEDVDDGIPLSAKVRIAARAAAAERTGVQDRITRSVRAAQDGAEARYRQFRLRVAAALVGDDHAEDIADEPDELAERILATARDLVEEQRRARELLLAAWAAVRRGRASVSRPPTSPLQILSEIEQEAEAIRVDLAELARRRAAEGQSDPDVPRRSPLANGAARPSGQAAGPLPVDAQHRLALLVDLLAEAMPEPGPPPGPHEYADLARYEERMSSVRGLLARAVALVGG